MNFWYDVWMDESPLINKVRPHKENYINKDAKVSDFIDQTKRWRLYDLKDCLPEHINIDEN